MWEHLSCVWLKNWGTVIHGTLAIVRDPQDIGPIFPIIDALLDPRSGVATEERVRFLTQCISAKPGCQDLFTDRPLATGPQELRRLLRLAPGTLGRTFAEHMFAYRLDQNNDFFTPISPRRDIEWLNLRIRQTHDIWHVLTNFGISYDGELGLQAFTAGVAPALLPQVAIALGVLRSLTQGARALVQTSEAIADGYHAARSCPQILTYRWENLWDRPLHALVQEIGLPQVQPDRPYALHPGPHPIPAL